MGRPTSATPNPVRPARSFVTAVIARTRWMKRAVANLPLHGGNAPAWLFKRMARLGGAVTMAIVDEYGPREMLRRLSDPWWFQAFACVLGFDWHSSGVTTVTCGALREAQRLFGDDLGIIVAGGKGKTSRKTPDEITAAAERHGITGGDRLVYASRMSAKVDSAAVQDGFQIYHHSFFMTSQGAWCVVQQGMNEQARCARRYHWLGETVTDFVCEPHYAVENLSLPARSVPTNLPLLNLVASEAGDNRSGCAELARQKPDWLLGEIRRLTEGPTLFAPRHHAVLPMDVDLARLQKTLVLAHENHPKDFETLLGPFAQVACEQAYANGRRHASRSKPRTSDMMVNTMVHVRPDGPLCDCTAPRPGSPEILPNPLPIRQLTLRRAGV